ncbi:MAG: RDD family protein [Opitutae bacterium]|mgnify:FL=1|jgi:uncharacterized RDD family membrane protein YckC|tara:strand:- start:1421 stop:2014 length:594 start_codon:yes stop_codon:yes gene_type:complete
MEFNSDEKQEMKDLLVPASLPKRMIAYAMDSILLFILIQLIALFIPKLYDENSKNEFNNLINKVSILSNDERFDSTKMAAFVEESRLSVETYQMLISMMFAACFLPVIYFFCGDAFFRGQTLGKATFGLRTVRFGDYNSPSFGKILIRAIVKGFATITLVTPFLLPGVLNFCFCLFNRNKRCVHDLLSGTVTTQPAP